MLTVFMMMIIAVRKSDVMKQMLHWFDRSRGADFFKGCIWSTSSFMPQRAKSVSTIVVEIE